MLLETKNLWLKTTEMQDSIKLHENFWSDAKTAEGMLWKPSQTIQESEKKLKTMLQTKETLFFTLIKKETKEPIGLLTITKNKKSDKIIDNIGFGFSAKETHKGYGLEVLFIAIEFCFNKLLVDEVNVSYLKNIGVSDNINKVFGFVQSEKGETQIKKKHTGEKLDVVNLTLSKQRWEMQKQRLRGH